MPACHAEPRPASRGTAGPSSGPGRPGRAERRYPRRTWTWRSAGSWTRLSATTPDPGGGAVAALAVTLAAEPVRDDGGPVGPPPAGGGAAGGAGPAAARPGRPARPGRRRGLPAARCLAAMRSQDGAAGDAPLPPGMRGPAAGGRDRYPGGLPSCAVAVAAEGNRACAAMPSPPPCSRRWRLPARRRRWCGSTSPGPMTR